MKTLIVLWIIMWITKCDLPIECLNSQITGEWEFELTKPQLYSLPLDNTCGHEQPDREQTSNTAMQSIFETYSSFKIYLVENGEIRSESEIGQTRLVGMRLQQQQQSGRQNIWTMLYDEGFEVEYEQYSIFVYSYYVINEVQRTKSQCQKTSVGWFRNRNTNEYGCIRGRKTKTQQKEQKRLKKMKKEQKVKEQKVKEQKVKEDGLGLKNRNKLLQSIKMRFKQKLQFMFGSRIRMDGNFSDHQIVIDRINSYNALKGKKWKAKMNHMIQNRTIDQIKSNGRRKLHKVRKMKKQETNIRMQLQSMIAVQNDIQQKEDSIMKQQKIINYVENDQYYRNGAGSYKDYQKLNRKVDQYLEDIGKKEYFNWEKAVGYNSRVYSQGDCGACYVISTLGMIDFRLRIQYFNKNSKQEETVRLKKENRNRFRLKKVIFKTIKKEEKHHNNEQDSNDNNKQKQQKQQNNKQQQKQKNIKNISDVEIDMNPNEMENLSPQYVLDCNSYTQGCEGGFAELVSRFSKENFLIGETFKPYNDGKQDCKHLRNIQELRWGVRVKSHGYVGGRYGNGDHFNMIKEIEKEGPIVASLLLDDSFYYYDEGIYEPIDESDWKQMNIDRPIYESVTHSILVYGWGEQDGKRYWIIQNSWGDSWGEAGSFKMLRGHDTQGIESQPEYAVPYIIQVTSDIYD